MIIQAELLETFYSHIRILIYMTGNSFVPPLGVVIFFWVFSAEGGRSQTIPAGQGVPCLKCGIRILINKAINKDHHSSKYRKKNIEKQGYFEKKLKKFKKPHF